MARPSGRQGRQSRPSDGAAPSARRRAPVSSPHGSTRGCVSLEPTPFSLTLQSSGQLQSAPEPEQGLRGRGRKPRACLRAATGSPDSPSASLGVLARTAETGLLTASTPRRGQARATQGSALWREQAALRGPAQGTVWKADGAHGAARQQKPLLCRRTSERLAGQNVTKTLIREYTLDHVGECFLHVKKQDIKP